MAPRTRQTDTAEATEATEATEQPTTEQPTTQTNGSGNAFNPDAARATRMVEDRIPPRRRDASEYPEWASEIEALRTTDLGSAVGYPDVPNISNLANGLRKVYGIDVATRKVNQKTNTGELWLAYPVKLHDNGNKFLVDGKPIADEDAVKANKAKYNK